MATAAVPEDDEEFKAYRESGLFRFRLGVVWRQSTVNAAKFAASHANVEQLLQAPEDDDIDIVANVVQDSKMLT